MKKHFLLFVLLSLMSGAMFAQQTFTIAVSTNPYGSGWAYIGDNTNQTQATFANGQSCTIHAAANSGYTFSNWTENGQVISNSAHYTFTVTSNRNLVANFTQQSYIITAFANPNDGGSVSGGGTYVYGQSCTLTATPANGYMFVNWTKNGTQVSTNPTYTFTVQGSGTYVANFETQPQNYTITVSASPSNGGSVSGGGTYQQGQQCTVHATANQGYTFTNWTENGNVVSTNTIYTFPVEGNRTLVANFTTQAYVITVQANPTNGGTVSGGGGYNYGQSCTLVAIPANGYTFVKWTKNGGQISTNPTYTFTVTESATYVAHFQAQTYTITASANPSNGGTVTGGGSYIYGQNCTLTATPANGYTFVRWTENGNPVSTNASYTFTVTGNRTLIAQFQAQTYTITATANPTNGGTVSGGGSYNYGQSCTLVAIPANGYTFVKWTKNGGQVSTNPTYTFTVTESATYVAHFQAQTYTITATANPSNGGTVGGGGQYNYGQSCTLTAAPATGYNFSRWTKNGQQVSTSPNYTFTVTESATCVAHFQAQSYTITVTADPANGGTVSGGGTYNYGQSCTLTATSAYGYTFVNWTKNGQQVSNNPSYVFTVTESAVYMAHFTQQEYIITAEVDPVEGGTVEGSGGYDYGDECTLTAIAKEGYNFINWTKNGLQVSNEYSFSFIVTESATYVAHFERKKYTITAVADPVEGGTVEGGGIYAHGAFCTLKATPNPGFVFANWKDDNNTVVGIDSIYLFGVLGDESYTATFEPIQQYAINVSANPTEGGIVTGDGFYTYGVEVSLSAIAHEGYSFVNWTENGTVVHSEAQYIFLVTCDRNLVANFTQQNYTIDVLVNPTDGGIVTGAGTYVPDINCILTATANEGFEFVNWTENDVIQCINDQYEFVVDRDRTVVANFKALPIFKISAMSGANGIIIPQGDVHVVQGTDQTFTMTPSSGGCVVKVLIDGVDIGPVESYTFTNVNHDHTIYVSFSGMGVEEARILDVNVYPNPAKDIVYVEGEGIETVVMYDMLGNCLRSIDYTISKELHVSGLPQGTYVLKLTTQDGQFGYKIIVLTK